MLAVALRATSGAQSRSFIGVIDAHPATISATSAAYTAGAARRFDIARWTTAARAKPATAPLTSARTGSLPGKRNQTAIEHQAPVAMTVAAKAAATTPRASRPRVMQERATIAPSSRGRADQARRAGTASAGHPCDGIERSVAHPAAEGTARRHRRHAGLWTGLRQMKQQNPADLRHGVRIGLNGMVGSND